MSTYTGIMVAGTEVESYRNHHSIWFFRQGDRIRENCRRDEYGNFTKDSFIGYRATAASIRRRMTLSGIDMPACEKDFCDYLQTVTDELRDKITFYERDILQSDQSTSVRERVASFTRVFRLILEAVKDTRLVDWIAAFPVAARLQKVQERYSLNETYWAEVSSSPLVNAMLSEFEIHTEFPCLGYFNFPGNDPRFFQFAFLCACPDDAVCELNIAPLIDSGYEEDFRDLEEIKDEETYPHRSCYASVQEITQLSDSQAANPSLQRMCYASIITAMEAYLGDILKREIFSRPSAKQLFVSSYEPFRKQKLILSELYTRLAGIDAEIKDALDGLSLHKIETARNIFSSTLLTEFPATSLPFLGAAVKCRHDIVHRNGKDTAGKPLQLNVHTVDELARQVLAFTRAVDAQILDGLLHEQEADEPQVER
ncbi:hypothetical protein IBT49_22945 [Erwinia sp. S63]|uniref:HEPN/Toprim-associated domain-containing protein n=1 Tax=Erwinia sp. S63 TaxID=2769341 RepID=UPI0019098179|nr:HEPN/Toprim-associated domain-containing protein [Erwinia sp. S63]MBK0098858.1 hypothetical protein [Erwinia sp. S63]